MKIGKLVSVVLTAATVGLLDGSWVHGQQTATSGASPTTAAAPRITPRGADARAAFDELSRRGMRVVMLTSCTDSLEILRPSHFKLQRSLGSSDILLSVLPYNSMYIPSRYSLPDSPRCSLLVPYEIRYQSVDGRKLVEAVAERAGCRVAWVNDGRTAVIQRGAAESEVKRVVDGLKSADVAVRRESAWLGGWAEDVRVVEALADSCRDADADTARLAAKSLIRLNLNVAAAIRGEKALPVLEKLAEDANMRVRESTAFALGHIGGEKALPLLEKLVGDKDMRVRESAAIALGHVGGEKALALLENLAEKGESAPGGVGIKMAAASESRIAGVEDKDNIFNVRCMAVTALGHVGGQKALALLEKLTGEVVVARDREVSTSEKEIYWKAAFALGQAGGEKVLPILVKFAEDTNDKLRSRAAIALGQVGGEKALALLDKLVMDVKTDVCKRAAVALGQIGGPKALVSLEKLVTDSNAEVRMSVAIALGQVGGEKALAMLKQLAADNEVCVRVATVYALGQIGGEKAVELLEKLAGDTRDANLQVRHCIAFFLGQTGSEKAITLLEKIAGDPKWGWSCSLAIIALGQIGGEKELPLLEKLAGDKNPNVRSPTIDALLQVGGKKALVLLERLTEDKFWSVGYRAAAALGAEKALTFLEKSLEDKKGYLRDASGYSYSIAEALGEVGGEKAVPLLEKLAGSEVVGTRMKVAESLGQVGCEAALPLLEKLSRDKDVIVRLSVAKALVQVGDEKAFVLLERFVTDADKALRRDIVDVLGQTGSENSLPLLEKFAGDEDGDVRKSLVSILQQVRGEKALSMLERLSNSTYEDVRNGAVDRLRTIPPDRRFPKIMRTAIGMLGSVDSTIQAQMADHIRRFEDADFNIREKAHDAIHKNFAAAEPLLQKTLKSPEVGAETRSRIEGLMQQNKFTLRAIEFIRDGKLLDDAGYLKELLKSAQGEDRQWVERRLREIEGKAATAPSASGTIPFR